MPKTIGWVARMRLFNIFPGHFGLKLSQSSLTIQPFPLQSLSRYLAPLELPLREADSNIWYMAILLIRPIFPGPTSGHITSIYCKYFALRVLLLGAPSQTHSSFLAKKWLELEVERALLAVWQLVLVASLPPCPDRLRRGDEGDNKSYIVCLPGGRKGREKQLLLKQLTDCFGLFKIALSTTDWGGGTRRVATNGLITRLAKMAAHLPSLNAMLVISSSSGQIQRFVGTERAARSTGGPTSEKYSLTTFDKTILLMNLRISNVA